MPPEVMDPVLPPLNTDAGEYPIMPAQPPVVFGRADLSRRRERQRTQPAFEGNQRMRYLAKSARRRATAFIATLALSGSADPQVAPTPADEVSIKLAPEIFQQLIEINTTDSVGSTTIAADAMAKRLRDAGFPADDVVVMGPDPRKGNMVA